LAVLSLSMGGGGAVGDVIVNSASHSRFMDLI